MKNLPKVHLGDEFNSNEKTIKRVNDVVIDKDVLLKASPSSDLKTLKKAPHPPQLPDLSLNDKLYFVRKSVFLKIKVVLKLLFSYYLILIIGILILLLGLYGMYNLNKKYNYYVNNFDIQNSDEIKEFCYDKNYKDCKNYLKYIDGIDYVLNKNYMKGKEIFEDIINFRDSNNYLNYINGIELMKSYNIDNAKLMFKNANLLDSNDYLEYIYFIECINNGNSIDNDKMYTIESKLNINYISNYYDSIKSYNEKNYKRIIDILENSSHYLNHAKEILNESKYLYAKNMQLDGFIGLSYKLLNEIIDYKDSKKILESPIYNVINDWYYENNDFSIVLLFYKSNNLCFNEINNGNLIGLPYSYDSGIYDYKIKNNTIYFKDNNDVYKPIYIIKKISNDNLKVMIDDIVIDLKPR